MSRLTVMARTSLKSRVILTIDTTEGVRFLASPTVQERQAKLAQAPSSLILVRKPWGMIALEVMGHMPVAAHKYLEGVTTDPNGLIRLQPDYHFPYTGARWRVHDIGEGMIALECMGHIPVAAHKYLEGVTTDPNGLIRLQPDYHFPYTGARWRIHIIKLD